MFHVTGKKHTTVGLRRRYLAQRCMRHPSTACRGEVCSLGRASFLHCACQADAFCQKGVQLAAPVAIAVLSRNTELLCWITRSSEAAGHLPRRWLQMIVKMKSQASSKDKLVEKWVLFKCIREWGRDKHYPSSRGCLYNQGRPQLSLLISHATEEWCPGARFHLSDSHRLGNRLHGCAGVRDQR